MKYSVVKLGRNILVVENNYKDQVKIWCQLPFKVNKVITTIVIRPLDDPTRWAQSVFADLRSLCLGYAGIGMSSFVLFLLALH